MNKDNLLQKFTEIVAVNLDSYDQRKDGVWPPNTDIGRWKRLYEGIPKDQLPPSMIEINYFKIEVDAIVSMLMQAVEEEINREKPNE